MARLKRAPLTAGLIAFVIVGTLTGWNPRLDWLWNLGAERGRR